MSRGYDKAKDNKKSLKNYNKGYDGVEWDNDNKKIERDSEFEKQFLNKEYKLIVGKRKAYEKKHAKVKCDCGHLMKDHYNKEGCCNKCGCTWYYPNHKYIMKQKENKC